MTLRRLLLSLTVLAAGCTKADPPAPTPSAAPAPAPGVAFAQPPPAPAPAPTPAPTPPPPPASPRVIDVELTAVTLADDCGGQPPHLPPAIKAKAKRASDAKGDRASEPYSPNRGARAKRRCEQTSMQLAITAPAASKLEVKSVELFDEAGASLGALTPSKPTRWSADRSVYETWDESLPAGELVNVSYVLSQPDWAHIGDRWNRTYTLKTTVTIGGVDQQASKSVTLSAPTTLPPNVKT